RGPRHGAPRRKRSRRRHRGRRQPSWRQLRRSQPRRRDRMFDVVLSALGGVLGWGIAEHLVHENLGHKYVKNRNFFAVEHVRHHATTSYFAPTRKKALVA